MGSNEEVHAIAKCTGPSCNYDHDYIVKNVGHHVCILPGSYTWNAIRLRIRRRREEGMQIDVTEKTLLPCKKCSHSIWVLEMPPRSASYFQEAFADVVVHTPRNLFTDGELEVRETEGAVGRGVPVERYLDVDNPPTDNYRDLVHEINLCFTYQAYTATIVLVRKAVENLIVDLLRQKYGMTQLEIFYLRNQRRFRNLSDLIANLRERLSDFSPYGLQKKHISIIEKLREEGNSGVHSIIDHSTRNELLELKPSARKAIKALLTVREALFKGAGS